MAWMTYIESTGGEQDNPFLDVHTNFVRTISDIEYLYFSAICVLVQTSKMVILNKKRLHSIKTGLMKTQRTPFLEMGTLTGTPHCTFTDLATDSQRQAIQNNDLLRRLGHFQSRANLFGQHEPPQAIESLCGLYLLYRIWINAMNPSQQFLCFFNVIW